MSELQKKLESHSINSAVETSGYLVLDTPALCRHLSLLRSLVKSAQFVVVVPLQGKFFALKFIINYNFIIIKVYQSCTILACYRTSHISFLRVVKALKSLLDSYFLASFILLCLISWFLRDLSRKHYFWIPSVIYPSKRQPHKMVKHTQTILRQIADELCEYAWPFCGAGALRVK